MCKYPKWITFWLLIIGGLNWGIFGLCKIDIVSLFFGEMTTISRIIYILVGISAILYSTIIYTCGENCKC